MSSFLPNASEGLYAAITAGVFSVGATVLRRRSERPMRQDAWEKQAGELQDELRSAYATRIAFLETQLELRDAELGRKDAEIARLNRLLNRRGGGSND